MAYQTDIENDALDFNYINCAETEMLQWSELVRKIGELYKCYESN